MSGGFVLPHGGHVHYDVSEQLSSGVQPTWHDTCLNQITAEAQHRAQWTNGEVRAGFEKRLKYSQAITVLSENCICLNESLLCVCLCAAQSGDRVELVAMLHLYGPEKGNSRYRWPVGVGGTTLHIHTHSNMQTNHRARFRFVQLHMVIYSILILKSLLIFTLCKEMHGAGGNKYANQDTSTFLM